MFKLVTIENKTGIIEVLDTKLKGIDPTEHNFETHSVSWFDPRETTAAEVIDDMLSIPGDLEEEIDFEPEYTLAGGYAALDGC